jgi:tripartite-type tricarboxylate transporter receptor subunit TctC
MHVPLKAAVFAIAGAVLLASSPGANAADFFKNKTVTLWIGGGVAGGVNLYGRTLAKHIMGRLPGKPDFVARNLPGAGGMGAVTTIYNRAKKDGTAFATFAQGPITDPLLRPKKKYSYDMLKLIWIGSLQSNIQSCYVRSDSDIKTVQDARDKVVKMAATGARSGTSKTPLALNAAIGTRFIPITGYRGSGGTYLAIERGETAGRCASYSSLNAVHPDWIEKKYIRFLVQIGPKPHPAMKGVPRAIDLALTEKDKALLRFMYQPLAVSNAFALPPGTKGARVKEWRAAFDATVKDAKFKAEAKKLKLELDPSDGDMVAAVMRQIYATPWSVLKRAEAAFKARKGRCNPKVSKKCKKKKKRKKKK